MEMRTLSYAQDGDGIATITLNDPQRPMNVVCPEFIADMIAVIDRVAADNSVKGAVITSGKPSFMAGADLKFILAWMESDIDWQSAYEFSRRASLAMHRRMETCGKPLVAAINGLALGGGYELTLACHRRVVADAPKISLGLPEVTVGLLAGSGGTQRLPRMIGVTRALPLVVDGKTMDPARALELGAVDQLAPPDELIEVARTAILDGIDPVREWDKPGYVPAEHTGLGEQEMSRIRAEWAAILEAKYQGNYPAPLANLDCLFEATTLAFDQALDYESRRFAELMVSPEARNIIRTTFVNKGRADKLSRRPQGFGKAAFRKVGVLGAGRMGSGIAHACARAGIDVVLVDTTLEDAVRGRNYSRDVVGQSVRAGRMTQDGADALLARITPTVDFGALADVDIAIEAVCEDRAVKAEVAARADATMPAAGIYASNSFALPISGLFATSRRPDRIIGLHFLSPADRQPLIEVIRGRQTGEETLARALDFAGALRMTPILVNDSHGFYTSRVLQAFVHEGMCMLEEGVDPALIEKAARKAGMSSGPLACADRIGIELLWNVAQQTVAASRDRHALPCGYAVLDTMVESRIRTARGGGNGFYDSAPDRGKTLWPGLQDLYPRASRQPDVEELAKRCLYIQALESARCCEEGVLSDPSDADLGAVLGWGFPSYTGGTLSLIDTLGIQAFVSECDRMSERHGPRFEATAWLRERAQRGEPFYGEAATT